jgi:hypothetical protein
MSSSETSPSARPVTLNVSAADPFIEIRLLNARFEPVTLPANVGHVTVAVPPGVYEVGFRTSTGWQSQHVVADPALSEVTVAQESPQPSDPLPAIEPRPQPQPGATVVVSLTGTTSGLYDVDTAPKVLVTLNRGDDRDAIVKDLLPGQWRSFQFAAPLGYWRLRLSEPGDRPPFELPLTVCPGYRVEVVAPLCSTGNMSVDLERLRVRLLPLDNPAPMDLLLAGFEEAALRALGSGRVLYGQDFEQLIANLVGDKGYNPMLGILAAHLCDRGKDDDLPFQAGLLSRLESLTGLPVIVHPDVAALRLQFRMRRGEPIDNEPAAPFPPLLAASWAALLDAARLRPSLIPAGSLCERVAARLWSSSLWVAWSAAPLATPRAVTSSATAEAKAKAATDDFASLSDIIASGLANRQLRDWFRNAHNASRGSADGLDWDDMLALTPAEAAVARILHPVAADEEKQDRFATLGETIKRRMTTPDRGQSDAPVAGNLTAMSKALGLPPTTVAQAVGSLAGKLEFFASDQDQDLTRSRSGETNDGAP